MMRISRISRLGKEQIALLGGPKSYGALSKEVGLSRGQIDSDMRVLDKIGVVEMKGRNLTTVELKKAMTPEQLEELFRGEKREKLEDLEFIWGFG